MIKVFEELLNDSAFDLEAYFRTEFAAVSAARRKRRSSPATAAASPPGIFNATGGGQLGVTAGSATAITADELIDLFYSLNSAYRKNAVWLLNDSTMKNIRKLKDSNGQYLWQPALHEGGFDTLLGKRIYTLPMRRSWQPVRRPLRSVTSTTTGSATAWVLPSKRLNERFAETGQIGFIASKRLDGKLILPEAIRCCSRRAPLLPAANERRR